jgi:hypothetical protein
LIANWEFLGAASVGLGGTLAAKIQKEKNIKRELLCFPPFRIFGTPKPEKFSHTFLILRAPIFFNKGKENFQILELKFFAKI